MSGVAQAVRARWGADVGFPAFVTAGLILAGALGLLVAALGPLGALGGLGVVLAVVGLRYPAVPFLVVAVVFGLLAATEGDNPAFLGAAHELYYPTEDAPPAVDLLALTAIPGAFAALARAEPAARLRFWTPLSGPVLALLASGLVSGLLIHRDGIPGLIETTGTLHLAFAFFVSSALFTFGHLSPARLLTATVVLAQVIGLEGIYNARVNNASENTIADAQAGTEQTLAFFDAASPFLLAVALAVLIVRAIWIEGERRWMLVALAVLPLAALILSVRRGIWIDAALAGVLIVGVSARARRGVLVPSVVVASVVLGACGLLISTSPVFQERLTALSSVFSADSRDPNIASRQVETQEVWRNVQRAPILGAGPAASYRSSVQFREQKTSYWHNNVLWVWLKFGLIGLLALAWLVWRAIRTLFRNARNLRRERRFTERHAALAAAGVGTAIFVTLFTASYLTADTRIPFFLGILFAAMGAVASADARSSGREAPAVPR